jgi:hypothetical protein
MHDMILFLSTNDKLVTAWTAIAALFVSLVSIILTFVSLSMQRRHNRRSVQPIGHISVGDYENEVFVRLRNDGIGPMIVKTTAVHNSEDGQTQISIIDFMPELPDGYSWTTFIRAMDGRAISANDHLTLVSLEGDPKDHKFASAKEVVRKKLSTLRISVEYNNIYGERMEPALRKLDWFSR